VEGRIREEYDMWRERNGQLLINKWSVFIVPRRNLPLKNAFGVITFL